MVLKETWRLNICGINRVCTVAALGITELWMKTVNES